VLRSLLQRLFVGYYPYTTLPIEPSNGGPMLVTAINAIRYTPAGGIINVHVRAYAEVPGAGAVLIVEDSGPGIPEHERELVFERFYRVLGSDPEGRNLDGSGLGLAIVREIASKHQARITIGTSTLGGTVFTTVFPRPSRTA
jgi:two-component system sensor histidine kinase TctE